MSATTSATNAEQSMDVAPSMPLSDAAPILLRQRLKTVERLVDEMSQHDAGDARAVHQMRVATRRAAAAIRLCQPCLKERTRKRCRRALRKIRRAASIERQRHVQMQMIGSRIQAAPIENRGVLMALERTLNEAAAQSRNQLLKVARRVNPVKLKQVRRELVKSIAKTQTTATLLDQSQIVLAQGARRVLDAAARDLAHVEHLHQLRLATKRFRYLLEIAEPIVRGSVDEVRAQMEDLQDRLGAINDLAELADRIETQIELPSLDQPAQRLAWFDTPEAQAGLVALAAEIRRESRQVCAAFLTWWDSPQADALRTNLHAMERLKEDMPRPSAEHAPHEHEASAVIGMASPSVPRIAAIDVGTNSVRLVIAEVLNDKRLRILDDERAVTRLGRGLVRTGRLSSRAMNESTDALRQFRAIAEGYRVNALQAVATCAVREARNGAEFVEMVKRKADIALNIISPEAEARLAFRSVSNAFDLHSIRSAAIDIGGGSTEIVLGYGDLIEQVFSLPIGAIRLTEKFRIADAVPDDRFRAMRKYIRRLVRSTVGQPMFIPHVAIGTGGTFTTLAAMSMMRGAHAKASELLPFNIRGYELQRSELKHILDHLRGLSLNGRMQVPGLSAERAEIIIAGLTIIDVVLKHLQVNTLRVHDQGVRAGLLHAMADELLPGEPSGAPTVTNSRMQAVRQFAASCNYEKEHSEQVSRLSLLMFDQLGQALGAEAARWATPENRELLHAAAILHDIGYFINYSQHHKHSYHLVMHSDLPGFTHRQREVIANVGRYHRGACPKNRHLNFARLKRSERELVRFLAAILRVADGLDRSHTSSVRSLEVHVHDGIAFVRLNTTGDAAVDIWGAQRKSNLFEEVFGVKIRFSVARADQTPIENPEIELPRKRELRERPILSKDAEISSPTVEMSLS